MPKKPHQTTCKEMEFAIKEGWVETNLLSPQLLLRRPLKRGSARAASSTLLVIKFCPFCGEAV